MIRCTKCGTINAETDIFCSKCASFLEWTGVKVDPADARSDETTGSAPDSGPPPQAPASETRTPTPDPVRPPQPEPPATPAPPLQAPQPPPPDAMQTGPFGASAPPPVGATIANAPSAPPTQRTDPEPAAIEPPLPAKPPQPEAPPPPSFRFRAAPAPVKPAAPALTSPAPTRAQPTSMPDEPAPVKPQAVTQPPALKPQAAAAKEPRARQPTLAPPPPRPQPQQHQSLSAEPEIRPGDLICAVCGAGNTPERRFCRRCGNSLAAATVAVAAPVPWYRRVFGGARQRRVLAAGDRPSSMGRRGRSAGWLLKRLLIVALVVIVVAPVVAYFAVPGFHDQVTSMLGQGSTNATLLQHPSTAALDKDINTFWLADQASGHASATVNFAQTTDLAGIIFHGGAPGTAFTTYGRPREIQIVVPGSATPVSILLNDEPGPQQRCLPKIISVRTFDIRIVSSYPPQGSNQNLVATREVEFIAGSCR